MLYGDSNICGDKYALWGLFMGTSIFVGTNMLYGDSNNEVQYMLTIERLLLQFYKWLENSCVKTVAYLKMQLRVRDMQLPAEESKRHKIGHKLQRACRTRWL